MQRIVNSIRAKTPEFWDEFFWKVTETLMVFIVIGTIILWTVQ